ncbi:Ig-like domain-containing protein [Ensifer sp. 22564]|uniref:Ig-like domain-containing protein n=1 Tax=Ensifer sp. 22564 TaxID=3453943 RepID=UPI003F87B36F
MTVDTTAPLNPYFLIDAWIDDVGSIRGTFSQGGGTPTDDTQPELKGSGAEPNSTVNIYDGATFVGSTTADAAGNWSFKFESPLVEGSYSFCARNVDAAGNEGGPSNTFPIVVDTTPPATPAAPTSYADDVGSIRNATSTAATTDDTRPGINIGTVPAGTTPALYVDGAKVAATYDAATGTLTPTAPLPEGAHRLSYTLTDPAGNESNPSAPFNLVVDTTAPTATAAVSAITVDTGTSAGDFVTSDKTLVVTATVTGTVAADERVQISLDNGATWHDATLVGGSYQYDAQATTLAEGNHTFQARVIDAAGNPGAAARQLVVIDATGPTVGNTVEITAYADDRPPALGDFGSGSSTNDTTPLLKGTVSGLATGDVVKIYEGTTFLGNATVAGGSWSLQLNGVSEGAHSYTAVITDSAGNPGTTSAPFALTVDTTLPPAVTVLDLYDDIGAIKGTIAQGGLTDDSRPAYSGTADASQVASVEVYDHGVLLGSAVVQANGSWSFTPTLPLASGDHSFTARPVDAAGNAGPDSAAWSFKLVGEPPAAPAIVGVTDDRGTVQGPIAKDAATDDTTPTISGTGTVGTVVTVYADGVAVGSATVAGDGTWSVTTSALSGDGTKVITAQAVDGAGQASPMTGGYPIVLDTTAPAKPAVVAASDDQGAVQGPILAGGTTDDTQPSFSGTAEPGATVKIYDGTTLLGTATVGSTGSWSFMPSAPLANGLHSITTTVTDAAGNTSAASDPLAFTVDNGPVVVSISKVTDDAGSKMGNVANGGATDDTTPTLVGTATAGATVTIREGATVLGTTTADATGAWSFTLPVQGEGVHSYTAEAKNAAGTTGTASFGLTIDTTPSAVPAIGGVSDDVGLKQGALVSGDRTDDTTPTVSGAGATPGDVINVYDNGALLGSTTVQPNGTWQFTPTSQLTQGAHALTVTSVDPVGNESNPSAPFNLVVDTTAPTATAAVSAITVDTGTSAGDFVTSDKTLVVTATVTGTVAADERVQISLDNGATWHDATLVGGSYQYDAQATTLAEGNHTFQARVIDAAGNPGAAARQLVVIDATGPTVGNTVEITAYADDRPPALGDFGSGSSTNDTTPLLKGTVSGLATGDVVKIYEGTTFLGNATVAGGSWSLQLNGVSEGAHSYTAVITDSAGNPGTTSAPFALTVDTTLPAAPVITGATDDAPLIIGAITAGSTTNDATPTLAGTAEANSTVTIYDNGAAIGTVTADASGNWNFTPPAGSKLADGAHALTATATDAAGNVSAASGSLSFTVDATPPAKPSAVAGFDDAWAPGPIVNGGRTDDKQPEFSGTVEPNSTVKIYDGTTLIGTVTAGGSGAWRFTPPAPLATGAHDITVTATDAAGNTSQPSDPLRFSIDQNVLGIDPKITSYEDDKDPVVGIFIEGTTTNDNSPLLMGTAFSLSLESVIKIFAGTTYLGDAEISYGGSGESTWSFRLNGLADGLHTYTAQIFNAVGTPGDVSQPFSLTVDTSAPTASASVSAISVDSGASASDFVTSDPTLVVTATVTGTVAANERVQISLDNGATWHDATLVSGTTYRYDAQATTLAEGAHTFKARVIDAAGNAGGETRQVVTVDATPPSSSIVIDIASISDDTGTSSTDFITRDTSLTVNGTLAGTLGTGEKAQISVNGGATWSDLTVSGGNWSHVDGRTLTDGSYTYQVRVVDTAGNVGSTDSQVVTVDATPPSQTIAISGYIDDAGPSQGVFPSGTTTDDRNPILSGTLSAPLGSGDVVKVYEGTTLLGTATVSGTSWTFDLGNLADGSTHSYKAIVSDLAGNQGSSANLTLTVDYTVTVNSQTTTDTTPLVTGAMPFKLANGEYIEVSIAGTTYSSANGAVVVDPLNNTWYVQVPSAVALGTYNVTAVIKSGAGVQIVTDDTFNELIIGAAPTVTVGAGGADPDQKATAVTIGENGMWRIFTNQAVLDANGTNSTNLGSFNTQILQSQQTPGANGGRNIVQNATFMDFNRDGLMDIFGIDNTFESGQQAFQYNGSGNYFAFQVGSFLAPGQPDDLDANTYSWYAGIAAFDKTGDGFVDVVNGDQTPYDANALGGFDSEIVLNTNGTIAGFIKDRAYVDDPSLPGPLTPGGSTGPRQMQPDMELSTVDLNNDGAVDLIHHATTLWNTITGTGATSPNQYRLVVAKNLGNGGWNVDQIVDNAFERFDDDPYRSNGVSMTWADFNGDGYMDLFMGRGYGTTDAQRDASRILFNDGAGHLKSTAPTGIGTSTGNYNFGDSLEGGASLAVDWNADGKMDIIELPALQTAGGAYPTSGYGSVNLYTNNTTSSAAPSFSPTALIPSIGGTIANGQSVTGAIAADIDWDGDKDLTIFTVGGSTRYVENKVNVATGTALHFRIVDAQGINALFGNTVQLFDSTGKLVASQIINPQSGNQTNDSSAIVDFYGLDPNQTYSLALLKNVNGASADVGGLAMLGGNTIENVNAAWTGLKAGAANDAYVLTAEAGTNVANANIGKGIVGTGYNDTFFATLGTDKYEGGGGTVTVSGVKAWSNTVGMDMVDYKLAGSTPLTINLSNTGAQNTGFGTATFSNIEGIAGGSGADTFTDNASDNVFEGRGGNDTFNLTNGGRDTLLYKLLANDATGGNGSDQVNGFKVGTYEATPNADRIDLKGLLSGYTADADGPAHYINGVATIDSGETIRNYLSVTQSGGNTVINVDRDGTGGVFSATPIVTLNNVTTDLETLLANHQIVV